MRKKILIIDEEKSMVRALRYSLENEGYEVDAVYNGREAIEMMAHSYQHYGLIILDLMLPEADGFEVCRFIRKIMNTPIIILSARDGENDKVMGLETGADDYLTKPFNIRELCARIKSILRRYEMVITDGLTGLITQAHFKQLLKMETERCIRYNNTASLIIIDIDYFKEVNDFYGHLTGDDVLVRIAAEAKAVFRSSDVIARYGGDEFTVLLPETGIEQAAVKAEKLRQTVERIQFKKEDTYFSVTISLGVVSFPVNYNSVNDFFAATDEALYYSKKRGKNRVSVYNHGHYSSVVPHPAAGGRLTG